MEFLASTRISFSLVFSKRKGRSELGLANEDRYSVGLLDLAGYLLSA
jgi:hypothetical protein